MDRLPLELVTNILSRLDFEEQFPHLPTVNSIWYAALKDIKLLVVKASPSLKQADLGKVVALFPLLQELHLKTADYMQDTALVHQIAQQFKGHSNLRLIVSSSDMIIKGVLKGCPKLESVILTAEPIMQSHNEDQVYETQLNQEMNLGSVTTNLESTSTSNFRSYDSTPLGPRGRRNIGLLLAALPKLKNLDVDGPSFWRRHCLFGQSSDAVHAPRRIGHHLESLKLTSVNSWTMINFLSWLDSYNRNITDNSRVAISDVDKEFKVHDASEFKINIPQPINDQAPLFNLRHLYLDIDYLYLPANAIKVLSQGSPNLQSLKIKFGILPHNLIFDIKTYMSSLKSLTLSKCDVWFVSQNWAHFCIFLASRKISTNVNTTSQGLETLSFNMCTIQILEDPRWHEEYQQLMSHTHHHPDSYTRTPQPHIPSFGLKQLKIFDTGHSRVDSSVLHTLIVTFPELTVLRLDVTCDCFPIQDAFFLESLRRGFANLRTLELRAGKPQHLPDTSDSLVDSAIIDQSIRMPYLKRLSLWCFTSFPHFLLRPNVDTIEELVINYPAIIPAFQDTHPVQHGHSNTQGSEKYSQLSRLKTLEIRGLSNAAHAICLAVLDMIASNAPNLTSLSLIALCRVTASLPLRHLLHLTTSSPNLTTLHTSGFIFPDDGFICLCNVWPNLSSLEIIGAHCAGTLTPEWEKQSLDPFMASHRKLYRLTLGISQLAIPGFELLNASALISQLTSRGNLMMSDFDSDFMHTVQAANMATYKRLGAYMRAKYFWMRECIIHGP
ncbi:hypothetical protein MT418_001207 [Batrachochytrium dendrobatidis]